IHDQRSIKTNEKDHLLDSKTMQEIIALYNALQHIKALKASYFLIDGGTGITAITNRPFKVIFQLNGNAEDEISKLQIFLNNNNPSEYIDLRFGDRIYWK
ncbi:MAG: hypothetical protein AAB966_00460, partial [Patescibacteria group bacterium]